KMQGWGARAIVVTKAKIVGGRYGFALGPVFWLRDVIDVPRLGLHNTTGYAFFDTYYQPLMLGWTTKQADFIAGYGFFAPTGNFDDGEGLGVYFDKAHRVAAAIAADLELHSKKKDKDLHVGDILTLEGGLGGRFAKGAGAYGLAYYAQWKVSDDSGADLPVVE